MSDDAYIAAYDFGTSGVKASLIDLDGNVRSNSGVNYKLITPRPGWAEQEPAEYWEACCSATKQAMRQLGALPEQVKGIAFGTQWKGIIPLDEQDRVLYNTIIWLDGRAGEQAEELNRRLGTDVMFNREYWPKLMWLKENMPETYRETKCFLEVNAYLKFKATGVKAADYTNHLTRAADAKLQSYYDRVLEAAGLDPDKFPSLISPAGRTGGLTEQAAQALGLAEGTPVFGGCGDIPAIAIGAGCSGAGQSHIYLGSSGWFGTVVSGISERRESFGELYQTFEGNKTFMLYPLQSACMTLNWAIEQFYRAEKEKLGEQVFRYVDHDIAAVEPGSLAMIAVPWIYGELRPFSEHAKALFFNVTSRHDRRHFISAIMEGICFTLRWKLDMYRQQTGNRIDSIRVAGGGACSAPWMQRLADILQIPVHIPGNPRHTGAVGTAYCAMIGLGLCDSFEEADGRIRIESAYQPNAAHKETYDSLFGVFRSIHPALEEIYGAIQQIH